MKELKSKIFYNKRDKSGRFIKKEKAAKDSKSENFMNSSNPTDSMQDTSAAEESQIKLSEIQQEESPSTKKAKKKCLTIVSKKQKTRNRNSKKINTISESPKLENPPSNSIEIPKVENDEIWERRSRHNYIINEIEKTYETKIHDQKIEIDILIREIITLKDINSNLIKDLKLCNEALEMMKKKDEEIEAMKKKLDTLENENQTLKINFYKDYCISL